MLYHYLASDKSGQMAEGDLEADNLTQVLQHLATSELRPVSVKAVKQAKQITLGFGRKISMTDKVFLTKYLALMLKVGTDLLSAINILIADFDKPAMRNFLLEVRENIGRGQPFYTAFEAHRNEFSPTFVSLVKAAEASGNLQETFERLSDELLRDAELQSRVRSALIYPIILVCAALGIMIFLVTFALPKVSGVFSQSGIKPPFFSQIVFGVGLFIGNNIVALLVALAIVVGGGLLFYYKTDVGKALVGRFLRKTPFIKNVYTQLAIQRLASTMSSLMRAGLPIIETINIAAETVGNSEFRFSLNRIANEGLAKGLTIGEAFKRESIFPKVVTNLIAVSEKAGHLEEVLATLADFYAANVDSSIKALVSLLEPALLLGMGVMVAAIALSIIVPIYQLTTQF
ncbi:MAG TPA: type II secretion system F family protein [Candidatus Paceibacterota bacterium]|nr:type II secretion system F family protein [Candidatus Paceibacterota bacterium]